MSVSQGPEEGAAFEAANNDELFRVSAGTDLLLVDHDEATLAACEAALAPLGRTVRRVASGIGALAELATRDFALMLVELHLPTMAGLETARAARATGHGKRTAIMFVASRPPTTDELLEAYALGAQDVLVSPVPDVLRARVAMHLQRQDRTRQLLQVSVELRDARRAAEETNRRKDDFLAMLGHELRNPLATMVSAIDLLKLREGTVRREIAIVDRQLAHMSQIVDDLLDVARIAHGTIRLRRDRVDLAVVVADVLEAAWPVLARRGHHVHVDVATELHVDADRHRLMQVLTNLLTNAITNTQDGGRIEIVAANKGDQVEIIVRDNGRGIAPAVLATMFEPFVQGERTLDRRGGGLGVGLTLVRTLVELHGGTIEGRSEGLGRGATFIVRWPSA